MRHATFVVLAGTMTGTVGSGVEAQTSPTATASCSVYRAAVATVMGTSSSIVVLDSTGTGVPNFAFRAFSGFPKTLEDQGFPFPDSLRRAFDDLNSRRELLAPCLDTAGGTVIANGDSLWTIFTAPEDGWVTFMARYGTARAFLLVSRPLFSADSTDAIIYVALAVDWLAGTGFLIRFRRTPEGEWLKASQAILWVS